MERNLRILVVNGSPKGDLSLSLQHSFYMLGQESSVDYLVAQAGEVLSDQEFDREWLQKTMDDIRWCDALVFTTPVYTMLVPWQLMRLFSLIKDLGEEKVFEGKWATGMFTCFHYYDHLAETWLQATCEDLGMHYIEGRTADNADMLHARERKDMRFFMHSFLDSCRNKAPVERKFAPLPTTPTPHFSPSARRGETNKDDAFKTVLLTDEYQKQGNLSAMIEVFLDAYPHQVQVIDINEFPFESGCKGCLQCEFVGDCARKDGFQDFYVNLVNSCDVIVYAMNLEARYLKPIWKLFLDRTFANGHRTSMMGKHTCYLVSGQLRYLPNVREFLEGKDQVGKENAVGIISDEYEDSAYLESLITDLARRLDLAVLENYQKSVNFLGLGGRKIFRDLIYGMRGFAKDDHRFYRKNKLYDFPQRKIGNQMFNILMGIPFSFRFFRREAHKKIPEMYILQHKHIVDSHRP